MKLNGTNHQSRLKLTNDSFGQPVIRSSQSSFCLKTSIAMRSRMPENWSTLFEVTLWKLFLSGPSRSVLFQKCLR